jgi:signal peptidase I
MHSLQLLGKSKRLILRLGLLTVLVAFLRAWVMSPVILAGVSMLPTCRDGEFALLDKLSYRWCLPRHGDLACVWTGKELYSKRIIGLPGDDIALEDGNLYINGKLVPESYVNARCHWTVAAGRLGPRSYVVIGDNRALPQSQAVIAIVSRDRIVGRLIPLL